MNLRNYIGLALPLALLASACETDEVTITRVQPNAIDKQLFEGIWYTRVTTIEADPESIVFEGLSTSMDKVRWDITEELLVAYRSYEFVPYAEGLTDEGRDFFGAPVAAFRIEGHFDIQRSYNPVTGVETAVLVENDQDRPWHERRFMRVDWSQNMVGTPAWFGSASLNGLYQGWSAGQYFVQADDPTNPDRPHITRDYMDFTNQYAMTPSPTYCMFQLLFQYVPRCGFSNTKVRLSFRKVDQSDDYESLYYPDFVEYRDDDGQGLILDNFDVPCQANDSPGPCFERGFAYDARFGNFRINRVAFDRERYLTRSGRIYMAGRYDLWEDSFDATGALIPVEAREPKPVVYYNNVETPPQIQESSLIMGQRWSEPFDETVAFLQNYRTQGGKWADVASFKQAYADKLAHPAGEQYAGMFQVRQNSCNRANIVEYAEANGLMGVVDRVAGGPEGLALGNLEQVCAAMQFEEVQRGATIDPYVAERTGRKLAFRWERKGDLRYNYSNYIEQLQNGPWGIAQFGTDPETGEYLSNIANYFGDAGDRISQNSVDFLQWANGDLSDAEVMNGQYVRDIVFSRRAQNGYDVEENIKSAMSANVKLASSTDKGESTDGGTGGISGGLTDADKYEAMFAGTPLEREHLITDDILRAFAGPALYQPLGQYGGAAPGPNAPGAATANSAGLPGWAQGGGLAGVPGGEMPGQITQAAIDQASPLNWAFVDDYNMYEHAVSELGSVAFDMADFFDPNIDGLASDVKGMPRDEIFEMMQTMLYEAVQGHEVGHAVGLRHNFEASMDPQNYRPEFWDRYYEQLQDGRPTPQNNVRSQEYKYASIMDYALDFTINGWHGLGSYDKAAIRFMYGQLMEAWDPERVTLPDPRKYGSFARHCGVASNQLGGLKFWTDPRSLPQIFGNTPPSDPKCQGQAGVDFDNDTSCDTALDPLFRNMAQIVDDFARVQGTEFVCGVSIQAWNPIFQALEGEDDDVNIPSNPTNIYAARMLVPVDTMIQQDRAMLANQPERDDPNTADINEATNGLDDDNDGVADDKGYDWGTYVHEVEYAYCTDIFAGFSNPFCQRWDAGWDFEEQIQNHMVKYDRDFIFEHFRRDRAPWFGFGNPNVYLSRVVSRRFKPMSDVFQYYLFTRESRLDSSRIDDWRESAIKGLNFLERILTMPDVGRYCLGDDEVYRLESTLEPGAECNEPYDLNTVGYGGGAYLDNRWDEQYFFNTTVIGSFWDKLGALLLLTRSSGFFQFDLSAIFDRRAFSLPYIRVFRDPLFQRFSAAIRDDHEGYRPRLVPELDANCQPVLDANGQPNLVVEPLPFLAGDYGLGSCFEGENIRQRLTATDPNTGVPEFKSIEPGWSYTLRLYALAFGLGNWSSSADFSVDYHRLTKVAIEGLPGDTEWVNTEVVSFTDPETLLEYVAPKVPPFREPTILPLIPEAYYGNRAQRARGQFHEWSVGAQLIEDLNDYKDNVYMPRREACIASAGDQDPTLATTPECTEWDRARTKLADDVGFLNLLRKFTEQAEGIYR